MEKKKNPRADIEKRKTGFFLIGLVIALSSSITVINLKWKELSITSDPLVTTVDVEDNEIQPRVLVEKPKVRQKIAAITDVFVIKDPEIEDKKEDPIITLKDIKDYDISDIDSDLDDIEDVDIEVEDNTPVPFALVGKFPMFNSCQHLSKLEDQKSCFEDGIMEHISKNFKYPRMEQQMGIEEKVYVSFIISKKGTVEQLKVLRGKNKGFEKEAIRLIESLPQFSPAEQRGKKVNMSYTIPINFKLK